MDIPNFQGLIEIETETLRKHKVIYVPFIWIVLPRKIAKSKRHTCYKKENLRIYIVNKFAWKYYQIRMEVFFSLLKTSTVSLK